MRDHHGLVCEIGKLERRDQPDVPQHRVVIDCYVVERLAERNQLVESVLQDVATPENAEARLHHFLHLRADLARLAAALAVADPVEALQGALLGLAIGLANARPRLEDFGGTLRRRAPEHDEVEKAVGAEPVGAMY